MKILSVGNMKKAGINGYVYNVNVDYDAIAVDDILDIHMYLMKKNNIKCWGLLKDVFSSNDVVWLKCTKMCFNEKSGMQNKTR